MTGRNGRKLSSNTIAVIAAIVANTIWGVSFMATKIAISHTSAHMLLSMRFLFSFLLILLIALPHIGSMQLKGKPILLFVLMGLCEPVIYFFAETNGIKYTTSSFSGLIISVIPVVTALLSVPILREHLTPKRFFWIVCSVAGVVIISLNNSNEGVITLKGVLFLLGAVLSASFFSILSRSISGSFSALERTFIMMLMGCIVFTGNALIKEKSGYGAALISALSDKYVLLPVLFLSVFCSVGAFFCLNYAMSYLAVNQAVIFTNIVPIVSVIAGVLVLGEPFSPSALIGIVLILVGVYMVNKVE